MDWNEYYLQQEEAEENEIRRAKEEKSAAEKATRIQKYNLCIDELRALMPKLLKFYEANPPSEHYWVEISGKKIASWWQTRGITGWRISERARSEYCDLYLLVDGKIAVFNTCYVYHIGDDHPSGVTSLIYSIELEHAENLFFGYYPIEKLLESACEHIKYTLGAPERELQAKKAKEERMRFQRAVVGKPENTIILEQQLKTENTKTLVQPQQNAKLIREAVLEQQKKATEQKQKEQPLEFHLKEIAKIGVCTILKLAGIFLIVIYVIDIILWLFNKTINSIAFLPAILIISCVIAFFVFIYVSMKQPGGKNG